MKNFIILFVLAGFMMTPALGQEIFRTQTIGGWGSNDKGQSPGAYLAENFEAAFADGIEIGYGDNTVLFTESVAIKKFLPASGTPAALDGSYIDPLKQEIRNTLVSQTLATTISIGLDRAITDFGESAYLLESLVASEGTFEGMMVKEILLEANKFLGGLESQYTAAELNAALTEINQSYVDGELTGSAYLMVTEKSYTAVKTDSAIKTETQTLESSKTLITR